MNENVLKRVEAERPFMCDRLMMACSRPGEVFLVLGPLSPLLILGWGSQEDGGTRR